MKGISSVNDAQNGERIAKTMLVRKVNKITKVMLVETESIKELIGSRGMEGQIVSELLVKWPKMIENKSSDSLEIELIILIVAICEPNLISITSIINIV